MSFYKTPYCSLGTIGNNSSRFFSVVKLTFENQTTIMPHIQAMELLMLAVKSFETTIVIKFLSLKRGEHNELFKESAVNGLIKRKLSIIKKR